MSWDADALAERRSLRRKVGFWRVVGVLALIVAIAAIGMRMAGAPAFNQKHVARVAVEGFIGDETKTAEMIGKLRDNDSVQAVVVRIDSPGGTTTGSESLYRELRRVGEKKPVIAFIDGLGASGGYIAAIGADRIVARETALVGSIGVLMQYPNVSRLLGTVGVEVESIRSTPLKASPSGLEPTPPEARAALQQVVNETYEWFKGLVQQRRNLESDPSRLAFDGRIFGARQALNLKLIDEIGGEREAIAWLEREKGILKDLPVKDWKPKESFEGFDLWSASASLAQGAGFERLAVTLRHLSRETKAARLDGMLALWQP